MSVSINGFLSARDLAPRDERASNKRRSLSAAILGLLLSAPFAHAVQPADLSLSNTVSNPAPAVGAQVTFTIIVANSGPGSVQSLRIRDMLPAGYTYVSHTATRGAYQPSSGLWNTSGLPNNANGQLVITATVKQSGNHVDVAEIIASANPDPDSTPNNGNPAEDDYARATTKPHQNVAPRIISQQPLPLSTPEDTSLKVELANLIVDDPDNSYPSGFTLTLQAGSNYALSAADRLLPDANYNGTLNVPVTVSDGLSSSAPFVLEVTTTAVNDPPVIMGQIPLSMGAHTALFISLSDLTVVDPDNQPGDLSLTLLPGTNYDLAGNEALTPLAGFVGELTVPVTVSDGIESSNVFALNVSVTAPPPPNIVTIMLDDLDNRSLQDLLNAGLLPNVQAAIIDRSVNFTQAHVTTPLCSPSRSSYYTGQYAHNHGIVNNALMYPGRGTQRSVGQFDDSVTVATRLRDLGYTTGHVGKYLNGYGSDARLTSLSPAFDPHYIPPGWSAWHGLVDLSTYCVYDYTVNHDGILTTYSRPPGKTQDSATYQTNVLTDIAESFLLEHVDDATPFYLEVMPLAAHAERCPDAYGGPPPEEGDGFSLRIRPAPEYQSAVVPAFVPSPSYDEDVSDKPAFMDEAWPALTPDDFANISQQYQQRLRATLSVDDLVRRIVAALGPRIDNTVLILTSDNGWFYGDHRLSEKYFAYEESAAVPLYIAMPGANAARASPALVVNTDLAPTLLDLASPGYTAPSFDGRSLVPLLQGAGPGTWNREQFLIEYSRISDGASAKAHQTYMALRNATSPYVETYGGTYYSPSPGPLIGLEKYDLLNDPNELNSLMHYPEDSRDPVLGPLLDQLHSCQGSTCTQYEDAISP